MFVFGFYKSKKSVDFFLFIPLLQTHFLQQYPGLLKIGYGIHIQGGDGIIYSLEEDAKKGKVISTDELYAPLNEGQTFYSSKSGNWGLLSLNAWETIFLNKTIILTAIQNMESHPIAEDYYWSSEKPINGYSLRFNMRTGETNRGLTGAYRAFIRGSSTF